MIEIAEKVFAKIGEDRACAHVEKIINRMKATDIYTGEQGERFMIYVPGSDDSGKR